jgi:hypothetical protein
MDEVETNEPSAATRGWNNTIVERDAEKARADVAEAKLAKVLEVLDAAFSLSKRDTFNGGPNALAQGAASALAILKGA